MRAAKNLPDKMKDAKEDVLYSLLVEMERIGVFEIQTTDVERKRVTKEILKIIKEGSIDELLDKMSGRWL